MNIISLRSLRLAALVAMQVALVAAVLHILGAAGNPTPQPMRWPELAGMMLLALIGSALLQHLPASIRPLLWLVTGVPLLLLLLKSMLGGGLAPTSGWEQVFETKLRNAQEMLFGVIALVLLLRRAITLPELAAFDLTRLFKRQVLILSGVMLLAPFFFAAALNEPSTQAILSGYVVAFIVSALLAIVLGQLPPEISGPKQRRLALSGMAPAAVLLALATLLIAAISPGARSVVTLVLGGLRDLLLVPLALLSIITSGISHLLIDNLPQRDLTLEPTPALPTATAFEDPQALTKQLAASQVGLQPAWMTALSYAVTLALLVGLGLLIVRWVRSQRSATAEEATERESVWSWQQLRQELRDLAGQLGGPLRRTGHVTKANANDPAWRIRRAYRSFLRLAAERTQGRQPQQTPREFMPAGQAVASAHASEIERLTALYEQARYGSAMSAADAAAAESAAQAIQASNRNP